MADFLFAVSRFELAKPVQIWGVREAPPVAGGATRTSGRGRQATSALRCATALQGTATGEHLQPLFKITTLVQYQSSHPGWLIFYFLKSIASSYKVCYNSSKGWQPIKKRETLHRSPLRHIGKGNGIPVFFL
jgi:hypothetical protein